MDAFLLECQRRHRRDCWWCLIAGPVFIATVLCLAGCGSSAPRIEGRRDVAGEVTLDGQPLALGLIEFVPQGNGRGPRAMAEVKEGKFAFDREHGPVSGPMRVEITSIPNDDEPPSDGQRPRPFAREKIPERYNRRSNLTAEVKSDRENVFQFPLKTR